MKRELEAAVGDEIHSMKKGNTADGGVKKGVSRLKVGLKDIFLTPLQIIS